MQVSRLSDRQSEQKPRYRPDIDGLRAVAVIAVILFHAGLKPFDSGFVGVDIFFVISGYLIGGIILRGVKENRFRFDVFYARRARRILPALMTVVTAVCVAGWFLMTGSEFRLAGVTAFSSLFAFSNISFLQHQDYFNPDARLSPLLMTWSLGVEEQFYIFFPFFILAAARFFPRHKAAGMACLTILSFALSIYQTWTHPAWAFYMLPPRAWELGAGALLAAWQIDRQELKERKPATDGGQTKVQAALSIVSLIFILAGIFGFSEADKFPGFIALLPVLGTAGLIATEGSFINRRLLSLKALTSIGTVSYSWYLWHWPVMSYIRIVSVGEPPVWLMSVVAVLTLGIAGLSWRFIEQPFRHGPGAPGRILIGYALALCILGIGGLTIRHTLGFPQRTSATVRHIESVVAAGRGNCLADFDRSAPDISGGCAAIVGGRPGIALIGDSHAAALGPALRAFAADKNLGIAIFTKSSCGPLLDTTMPKQDMPASAAACSAFMTGAMQAVAARGDIKTVLLAGYWNSYKYLGPAQFSRGLDASIEMLKAAGKQVVVVGDAPYFNVNPVNAALGRYIRPRGFLARLLWFDGAPYPDAGVSSETAEDDAGIASALAALSRRSDIGYIDLTRRFCPAACLFENRGDLLYIDRQHLSEKGAAFALADMLK